MSLKHSPVPVSSKIADKEQNADQKMKPDEGDNSDGESFKGFFPIVDDKSKCERQINHLSRQLERLEANYEKRCMDSVALKLFAEKLKELSCDSSSIFATVMETAESEEMKLAEEQFTTIDDLIFDLQLKVEPKLQTLNEKRTHAEPSSAQPRRIKLPELKLPSFDGAIRDWPSFRDAFCSIIDSADHLTERDKLTYLQSSVTKEAKRAIENIRITSANYAIACKLLTDKYENKYMLRKAYCDALFEIVPIKKECPEMLNNLINEFERNLRMLQNEGENTENWSTLLVFRLTSLLDSTTLRQWELTRNNANIPTYTELIEFLRNHCRTLQSVKGLSVNAVEENRTKQNAKDTGRKTHIHTTIADSTKCVFCTEPKHSPFSCQVFRKLPVVKRKEIVKNKSFCFNCFSPNHRINQCSSSACRVCGMKHHTMLHEGSETQRSQCLPEPVQKVAEPSSTVSHVYMSKSSYQSSSSRTNILLQTAIVKIMDSVGQPHHVRILLDSGAQLNIITQELFRRLRLPQHSEQLRIGGIGKTNVVSHHHVTITLKSNHSDFTANVKCHVLPEITNDLPASKIDVSSWNLPSYINLAQPTFCEPGKIDILMGIDLFYNVVEEGLIKLPNLKTILQKSSLGWLVAGHPTVETSDNTEPYNALHACTIEEQVAKFWELEACQTKGGMSIEEAACEEYFLTTYKRDITGRFVVKLPTKPEVIHKLGNSYAPAEKRLNQLIDRFRKNTELKKAYIEFLSEYVQLGHMEEVELQNNERSYFLPHHSVLRPDSLTTKLRVVFDASGRSNTGVSLNDALMIGPVVQHDLISIILRFRMSKYAIIADIEKMYRQILVHESDRKLQQILWKSEPNETTRIYQLKTVTYGTSAAPYLATRCLTQLAKEGQQTHPIAAEVLNRDFYMDDLLTGVDDFEHVNILCHQLISLLNSAGFHLHKWASNAAEILQQIPKHLQDERTILQLDETSKPIKTLGLKWDTKQDMLIIDAPKWKDIIYITKRSVLSDISRLFDPLGLVGPVILLAKLFLQDLWKEQIDWDEPLSDELQQRWLSIRNNMAQLHDLSVPRWVLSTSKPVRIELHGFCDACERAYGACIYVRTIADSDYLSSVLLISKSRVAPIGNSKKERKISLPRLELCSAHLLAQLYHKVRTAFHTDITSYFWSDSTIVLCWLSSPSSRWKNFIANRVSDIQHLTSDNWRHVPGLQNPADHISRGVNPDTLKDCHDWWNGPDWLTKSSDYWPTQPRSPDPQPDKEVLEERTILVNRPSQPNDIFLLCSSYNKLQQRIAWMRRFLHNIKPANKEKNLNPSLTLQELHDATKFLVRLAQKEVFAAEFASLTKVGQVDSTSRLKTLTPYLDDNLLRVGGRLRHADVSESRKHPLILPAGHPLTLLIARHYHHCLLHAGPQLLISSIREKFWPLRARNLARRVVHSCVSCFRCRPTSLEQLMADLPRERVTPTLPFLRTGVDLCGPVYYKYPQRKAQPIKSYVAIFVCLAVKAVHIELVADLTTNAFLAALRRFVSRRGRPQLMECDNAKNFVGASREIAQLVTQFQNQQFQQTVIKSCANEGIDFKFIPPRSPNFGGLWEAAVKSFKTHLKPTIGNAILTHEEFTTLLTQIESCLNSRPLTPLSSDPNDFEALTPSHFLIHRSQAGITEPSYENIPTSRLDRYQQTQEFLRRLWKRWSTDYLSGLHPKTKWTRQRDNITIGTMVLVKEDNLPPLKWCLGRVINVIKGADDNIRVVEIRTKDGQFKRSISKICVLPINESNVKEC